MTADVHHRSGASTRRLRSFLAPAAVGASAVGVLTYVAVRNPFENQLSPVCGFYHLTGMYCPGCGATRASYALMQGDIGYAIQLNALFVLVFVPLGIVGFAWWIASLAGVRVPAFNPPLWLVWALVGLIGVFWVVRNLPPVAPFLTP